MRRRRTPSRATPQKVVRCAIYTRKSTDEGLEQDFNSLDAQRESAENYIASQKAEGWDCLPDRYDDGGFTGGNMERPALRRLMADMGWGTLMVAVVRFSEPLDYLFYALAIGTAFFQAVRGGEE